MSIRKRTSFCLGNQRGMAMVSALLLLMIVSFMAVGMSTDTSMDVRIAGFQKFKAIAFGYAESGMNVGTEILEDNIYEAGWTLPTNYPNLSASYSPGGGTITIINDGNFYMNDNFARQDFMTMTGDIQAGVVVQKVVSKLAKGSAIQVAAGYEGIGKGSSSGGVHVIYNLEATGTSASQAQTEVGMHYRHVTK